MWINATCDEPMTCDYCGKTQGEKLGHNWKEATCTEPRTCKRCGDSTGNKLGHSWKNATCTAPSTCARCEEKSGKALGHNYYGGKCKSCGIDDSNFIWMTGGDCIYKFLGVKSAEIDITGFKYEIKGSDLYIYISGKKTYDILGNSHNEDYEFDWKLYDNDKNVVAGGTIFTYSLEVGDTFKDEMICIRGADLSKRFVIEIINDSLNPWP